MRFTYFALALALLTLSATAQDKKKAPAQSSTSVLINGQPIQGKVLEMDGKHFVAVEDVAQSLRGTIAYGEGRIALTLSELPPMAAQPAPAQVPSISVQPPSSQLPPVTAQPAPSQPPSLSAQPPSSQLPPVSVQPPQTGNVKGMLTYFFDFRSGNKPDTGSKLWLVKGRVEIPVDKTFVANSTALGTGENPEQYTAVQYSIANENGYFELHDVFPGEYTLILQSAHTQ
jgi:hypothetical protein